MNESKHNSGLLMREWQKKNIIKSQFCACTFSLLKTQIRKVNLQIIYFSKVTWTLCSRCAWTSLQALHPDDIWHFRVTRNHECPVPLKVGHHQMCSTCFSQSSNTSVSITIMQPQRQPSRICASRIYTRHTETTRWRPQPTQTWTPALTYRSWRGNICLNVQRRSFDWPLHQQQALQSWWRLSHLLFFISFCSCLQQHETCQKGCSKKIKKLTLCSNILTCTNLWYTK